MFFFSFKFFLLILALNIILGLNKNNKVINIYEKKNTNKKFYIRINKSLAEYIKKENTNYESTEFDLLYEELVKQKLKNYQRLMDIRKKEKNYEKKKRRDKKWQDKVVKRKMKQYYILRDILNCENNKYDQIKITIILNNVKKNIKDKLYENIFKGTRFWKDLGFILELLGIYAVESKIFLMVGALIFLFVGSSASAALTIYVIVCAAIFGVLILLILITVIIVALLVVWLWPKDDKNIINKKLWPK